MTIRNRRIPGLAFLSLVIVMAGCLDAAEEAEVDYALGNDALANVDFKRALLHYDEAIRQNPAHAGAHLKRGQIRWQGNQYEQALPDLSQAIELDSTLTWAYFFRGVCLITLDRLEDALPDFTRVIERYEFEAGDIARALTWRSIALFKLERYDEAIADLTARVELEPEQMIHRIDRGGVYEWVGETEKAVADYRFVLDTEGLAEELRLNVAGRLASLGVEVLDEASNDSTTVDIG
ncbi:MAG: tetratricopeptide repeat protein [Rhodothermales bacterium]|nr:tetratricopeptide repeat protein [Rhodothermales bacterium]